MDHAPSPDTDFRRRREAFADLIARAALAPNWQRDALLSDATMLAHGHHELTGTPLLPDIDTHPAIQARLRRLRAAAPRRPGGAPADAIAP